jgi:hypothetical protein
MILLRDGMVKVIGYFLVIIWHDGHTGDDDGACRGRRERQFGFM